MPVPLHVHQVVPFHPGDRLRHRRTTLMQPLGDPGPERDDALLLELVDRPQVHLRGVDQVAHVLSSLTLADHVRVAAVLDGELARSLTYSPRLTLLDHVRVTALLMVSSQV